MTPRLDPSEEFRNKDAEIGETRRPWATPRVIVGEDRAPALAAKSTATHEFFFSANSNGS